MRIALKWGLWIAVVVTLASVVVGIAKRDEIARLMAVNTLFDEDRIVANFSAMDAAFLTTPVPRGQGKASDLPRGAAFGLPPEATRWVEERDVTSLMILKDGQVRFEEYYLGTGKGDRRISWSIAKSYLSALFGVLVAEGAIGSLDDPVVRYAPELKGSAYDGASIRNVLQMASGVEFDEDYLDYNSDINRMGRVVALGRKLDDFTAALDKRSAVPGETWQYVSIDTHVVGMVIRGATGRDVPSLLAEKIIAPLGLERDGYYITDGAGVAFVLGGLNFTTRDYARFGQMILQNGEYGGTQVVAAKWLRRTGSRNRPRVGPDTSRSDRVWLSVVDPGGRAGGRVHGAWDLWSVPVFRSVAGRADRRDGSGQAVPGCRRKRGQCRNLPQAGKESVN